MLDLIYVAVIVAFFVLCAAYVGGCARIVGRESSVEAAQEGNTANEEVGG